MRRPSRTETKAKRPAASGKSIEGLFLPQANLTLAKRDGEGISATGFELLEQIAATGSLTQAAKAVGISYRSAWDTLVRINNLSEHALVETSTGGAHGGGARLSPQGKRLLEVYAVMQAEHRKSLEVLRQAGEDFERFYKLTHRITMRVSTRNQLFSRVAEIQEGTLFADVRLELKGGHALAARITQESISSMGLKVGDEVFALFKATWVGLDRKGRRGKVAINQLAGVIKRITVGEGYREAMLELSGGLAVVSSVPDAGFAELGLKEGDRAYALVPPESIILGVNH